MGLMDGGGVGGRRNIAEVAWFAVEPTSPSLFEFRLRSATVVLPFMKESNAEGTGSASSAETSGDHEPSRRVKRTESLP